jgi:hypothetical protein
MRVDVSDLITQTTAARLRGVSRPAIHDLVLRGRLRSIEIDGTVFVYRSEVLAFKPPKREEVKAMTDNEVLQDVLRVADLLGRLPSSYEQQKHGQIHLSTLCKRFGGWSNVHRAARRKMKKT